jgi:hypothetical protein
MNTEESDDEDSEIDAETLLASICLEAQTNEEFNAESVREILESAGALGLWEAAGEMVDDEDEEEGDEEEETVVT